MLAWLVLADYFWGFVVVVFGWLVSGGFLGGVARLVGVWVGCIVSACLVGLFIVLVNYGFLGLVCIGVYGVYFIASFVVLGYVGIVGLLVCCFLVV